MPHIVDVPGVGPTEFPDGMSDAAIAQAIQSSYPQFQEKHDTIEDLNSKFGMQPEPKNERSLGNILAGAGEAGLGMATGMFGDAIGLVGALGKRVAGEIGPEPDKETFKHAQERISKEATAPFMPQSEIGQTFMNKTADVLGMYPNPMTPEFNAVSHLGQAMPEVASAATVAGKAAVDAGAKGLRNVMDPIGRVTGYIAPPFKEARIPQRELRKAGGDVTFTAEQAMGEIDKRVEELKAGKTEGVENAHQHASRVLDVRSEVEDNLRKATVEHTQAATQLAPEEVSEESLGSLVQKEGSKTIEKLELEREKDAIDENKDPAFERGRMRAEAKETPRKVEAVKTLMDSVREWLREERKKLPTGLPRSATTRDMVNVIIRKLGMNTLTLDQLESMRRELNDAILSDPTGNKASWAVLYRQIGRRIQDIMEAYEPDIGKYIAAYKKGSLKINQAEGGAAGKNTLRTIDTLGDSVYESTAEGVARKYFDGSAQQAQKAIELVGGKTPELVAAVRGYLRRQIMSKGNAQAMAKFIKDNEGLLQKFPELKADLEGVAKSKARIEHLEELHKKVVDATKKASEGLAKERKAALDKAVEQEKVKTDLQSFIRQLEHTEDSKGQIQKMRAIINKMDKLGMIDPGTHAKMLDMMNDVERKYSRSAVMNKMLRAVFIMAGLEVGGRYYGYLLPTPGGGHK